MFSCVDLELSMLVEGSVPGGILDALGNDEGRWDDE